MKENKLLLVFLIGFEIFAYLVSLFSDSSSSKSMICFANSTFFMSEGVYASLSCPFAKWLTISLHFFECGESRYGSSLMNW